MKHPNSNFILHFKKHDCSERKSTYKTELNTCVGKGNFWTHDDAILIKHLFGVVAMRYSRELGMDKAFPD